MTLKKQSLSEWLKEVDYDALNRYEPSELALKFVAFIKLVNGAQGESHPTPPFHLYMLDKLTSPEELIVNLCFRGSGKTSV